MDDPLGKADILSGSLIHRFFVNRRLSVTFEDKWFLYTSFRVFLFTFLPFFDVFLKQVEWATFSHFSFILFVNFRWTVYFPKKDGVFFTDFSTSLILCMRKGLLSPIFQLSQKWLISSDKLVGWFMHDLIDWVDVFTIGSEFEGKYLCWWMRWSSLTVG